MKFKQNEFLVNEIRKLASAMSILLMAFAIGASTPIKSNSKAIPSSLSFTINILIFDMYAAKSH